MVQSSVSRDIGGIHWTPILHKELHHGYRSNRCSSMESELATFVLHPRGRFMSNQFPCNVKGVFRSAKMQGSLLKRLE